MKRVLLAALVLLLATGTAMADKEKLNGPPSHPTDGLLDCTGAHAIACGGSHSDDTTLYPSAVSDYNMPSWTLDGPEVVYELTIAADTYLTLDLTFPTAGDLALLLLASCDENTVIDYSDAYGDGAPEQIAMEVTAGTYIVVVEGWYADDYGPYTLTVSCEAPPEPPVNDQCAGAIEIVRCSSGVVEGDLTLAVDDYTPSGALPSCTGYSALGKDIVYVMDLQVGDEVSMSMAPLVYFDAALYLISDCADPNGTCKAGSDSGNPEAISWICDAAGTYYLICDAWSSGTGGPFTLTYSIECPPVPDDVESWGTIKSIYR
ncbi:MAG: hypothetical protein V1774_04445 [Candidatus Eisenbacteria bacterium]